MEDEGRDEHRIADGVRPPGCVGATDRLRSWDGIAQALTLARLLGAELSEMLGESVGSAPIGIPTIRAGMAAQLDRSPGAREELEDLIDWDLGPFLEGADQWTTVYTLDFMKRLSTAIGLTYGEVLAGLSGRS